MPSTNASIDYAGEFDPENNGKGTSEIASETLSTTSQIGLGDDLILITNTYFKITTPEVRDFYLDKIKEILFKLDDAEIARVLRTVVTKAQELLIPLLRHPKPNTTDHDS